jgi:hypothetical protein
MRRKEQRAAEWERVIEETAEHAARLAAQVTRDRLERERDAHPNSHPVLRGLDVVTTVDLDLLR